MTRIHVFCEGQTEDVFVREVLSPHFKRLGIWLNPIVIRTGPQGRGGAVAYGKIKWQVERKCKEDPSSWVTTLLDFYGLPKDFPSAPSKRILAICSNYDKPLHGSLIALGIGLDVIRRECPLFDSWVRRLEGLQAGEPS
ncbi:MAG: DUF4276 family protein [Thermodesulfobacteriota bacterium]